MIEPEAAQRARTALGDVLGAIDGGEVRATRGERAYISGVVDTLDALAPAAEEEPGAPVD